MTTGEMMQDRVRSQLASAIAYQRAGHLADAVKTCNEILASRPNNFDAIYLLAMFHAQQGTLPAAVNTALTSSGNEHE